VEERHYVTIVPDALRPPSNRRRPDDHRQLQARPGAARLLDVEANPARFVVEPGTFGLYIGGSLRVTRELTFEVL
jgi:hypothetical protein